MPALNEKVRKFYHSKQWRDLSYLLRIERGHCERCGRIVNIEQLHAHHKIELTESNVDDANISLNSDKIEVLCNACHDEEHNRFGSKKQEVFIVYGAPCSGKTSYALEQMKRNDIIIDLDLIYESITGKDGHYHPDALRFIAFKIRDTLYDIVRTRYGYFDNAYIVAGLPYRGERQALANRLQAELIHIDTSEAECIERAKARPIKYIDLIKNYFKNFEE